MIGKLSVPAVLAGTLLSCAAFAADLPSPVYKAPLAVPAYNWTGFYVGGHAGYGWADHSFTTSFADAATAAWLGGATAAGAYNTAPNFDSDGWLAGFQMGYNFQSGRYVLGVEGDMSWTGLDATQTTAKQVGAFAPSTTVASSDFDWFGTLRGRLGILPSDQLLVYATAGLAFGRTNYSYAVAFPLAFDYFAGSSGAKTEWGWTIGGGAEFAVSGNWTAKLEYLYYDLGDRTFQTVGSGTSTGQGTFNVTADNAGHVVRLGLNYRFKPPITAKY